MNRRFLAACAALAIAGTAAATDIKIDIRSNGLSLIDVAPGATVTYTITGELTDNASLGLAMFTMDVMYSGGPMTQPPAPTTNPMKNFAVPLGVNNPAGYGGTLIAGKLRGVGGAQNTINNTFAPIPTGTVLTNVGQPGSPVVLLTGTVVAPDVPGMYTVTSHNLMANVIRTGETGTPFWHVDACNAATNNGLFIRVGALHPGRVVTTVHHAMSLQLDGGVKNAGHRYLLLGSMSGTAPGTLLENGARVPLTTDAYFAFTQSQPNSAILSHSFGVLDANGRATATFTPDGRFANTTVTHAFVVLGPSKFVSEPQSCQVVP
jgi:hypothetical protein